jgi:hypothetical protein
VDAHLVTGKKNCAFGTEQMSTDVNGEEVPKHEVNPLMNTASMPGKLKKGLHKSTENLL